MQVRWILTGMIALAGTLGCALASPAVTDPYVLLDEAKLVLGAGRLAQARELLSAIPTAGVEEYIAEELVYQQLLIAAAYLSATHYLLEELQGNGLGDTEYGKWLLTERAGYVRAFIRHASTYLTRTADSPHLEFVRFRLPRVTDDYLMDTGLYAEEPVLAAACTNWEDDREGLGRGIIQAQARVALVLSAAVHYDLPEASATLEDVARRLRVGVPIDELTQLDWLAATAVQLSQPGDGLLRLAARADERIIKLTADQPQHPLRERAFSRLEPNNQVAAPSQ